MSKMIASMIAAGAFMVATGSHAQTCESLLNTKIAPVAFDQAVQILRSSGATLKKDEFETTAQFEARVAASGASAPPTMLVSVAVDPEYISYNADAGVFEIRSYAVANTGADWFTAFYGSPHYGVIEHGSYENVAVVVSNTDRTTGTYQGKNGYGATWQIAEINRTVRAIFDRKSPGYGGGLFGNNSSNSSPTWQISVPVDQARGMKERFRGAFLIAPKVPFFFENTQPSSADITIQNPRDITQISKIIVADIQCALITDDAGNVLSSSPTN